MSVRLSGFPRKIRVERTPLGLVMAILVLVAGVFGAFVIFL